MNENISDEEFEAQLEALISNDSEEPENEIIEDTEESKDEIEDEVEAETEELIDDETPDTENTEEEVESGEEAEKSQEKEDEEESEDEKVIDYKKEYQNLVESSAQYKNFYDSVTGEFTANGVKVKGFTDPKKVIQAQQMAANYATKMAELKPYNGFIKTLKDKGLVENKDKFNFALQLLDGDQEAIKQHIKQLEIDPFELDMDEIKYEPKNHLPSDIELNIDEVMTLAKNNGVDQQVSEVISKQWDDESVLALLDDKKSSQDLVEHIKTGVYDLVQQRIAEKKVVDYNQEFVSQPSIQQYRIAMAELEQEYVASLQQNQQQEQEWIVPDDAVKAYTEKVKNVSAKVDEARKKAASVSKRKRKPTKAKTKVDPLKDLDDNSFEEYLQSIIDAES